jgi:hypothetical protein
MTPMSFGKMIEWLARYKGRVLFTALVALLVAACSTGQKQTATESAGASPSATAEKITPDDVSVSEVHLFKGDTPNSFRVEGNVQNNSAKMTLTEISLEMAMQDCLDTGVCNVIAQDTAKISTNVAPGQTAAFETVANFKDMPKPQGTLGWHYSVVDAKSTP